MKSITIHNLDDKLDKLLKEKAAQDGTSINKTIKELLQQCLGISRKQKKSDFSEFSGVWTRKEFEEFEDSTKGFEKVDSRDWK